MDVQQFLKANGVTVIPPGALVVIEATRPLEDAQVAAITADFKRIHSQTGCQLIILTDELKLAGYQRTR